MSTPEWLRPSRNEIAREEAEDRLEDCIESGQHLTDTGEYGHCLFCGWAGEPEPDEPALPNAA